MKRTDITDVFPEATAEQVDKLVGIHGADINSAKAGVEELRSQLEAARNEIEALKTAPPKEDERVAALQAELESLKAANSVRDVRDKISKETGVPASLLTASTEEDCKAQAEAIKAYAAPAYPEVKDGGEVKHTGTGSTREKFRDWFESNITH